MALLQERPPFEPEETRLALPAAARRVLLTILVCLGLWLLLDAPALLRSAEAAPLGARRSAAILVLRPLAWLSSATHLAEPERLLAAAIGRPVGGAAGGLVSAPPLPVLPPQAGRAPTTGEELPPPYGPGGGRPRPGMSSGLAGMPPATVVATFVPTQANPLRVLMIGDSIGQDLGQALAEQAAPIADLKVIVDTHLATGLARPDYFNWPARLRQDLARTHPDVVVAIFGANDDQGMLVGPDQAVQPTTAGWRSAYAKRVAAFIAEATHGGTELVWVGAPPMQSPGLSAAMAVMDRIYQSQVAAHTGVQYVNTWRILGSARGGYAQFLPGPSGEQEVRDPDGIHLSPVGADRVGSAILTLLALQWRLGMQR